MAEGEKWETVTGKSKKAGGGSISGAKSNGKAFDRKYVEAVNGPNIESKTIFNALSPKEKKEKASSSSNPNEKKSGIPRPQKKDGAMKKSAPGKLKLETYVPTVSTIIYLIKLR